MWPISIISLSRATGRRAACVQEMSRIGLDFSFFDAVDGSELTAEEMAAAYDASANGTAYKHPLTRSEIGCYLSHWTLWRRIANGEARGGTILEDDFLPDSRLPTMLDELAEFDLGNCIVKLHAQKPVRGETICKLAAGFSVIAPGMVPGLALGYAIGKEAAQRLTNRPARFSRPVDIDMKHWWEFGAPVLCVQPSALRHGPQSEHSFIEQDRSKRLVRGIAPNLRRMTNNLRYQARYLIAGTRARPLWRNAIAEIKNRFAEKKISP